MLDDAQDPDQRLLLLDEGLTEAGAWQQTRRCRGVAPSARLAASVHAVPALHVHAMTAAAAAARPPARRRADLASRDVGGASLAAFIQQEGLSVAPATVDVDYSYFPAHTVLQVCMGWGGGAGS